MFKNKSEALAERNRTISEIIELRKLYNSVVGVSYNKNSKDFLNAIADNFKVLFKDYRSAIIKRSTKSDLPVNITLVINKTLAQKSDLLLEIDKEILAFAQKELIQKRDLEIKEILALVDEHQDTFANDFDDLEEGLQSWQCLLSSIEGGQIDKSNLHEYGININKV